MTKPMDLKQILRTGTARKKALLVATNSALLTTEGKKLLEPQEIKAILGSLKTDREGDIYNAIVNAEYNVRVAIPLIRADYFHLESMTNLLMQYCYIEDVQERIFDDLNMLIFDEGKTSEEAVKYSDTGDPQVSPTSLKKRLAMRDKILKHVKPFLMDLKPHEDTFVKAVPDEGITTSLPKLSEKIQKQAILIKSRIKAIRDYLEEKDAKIKPYLEFLDGTEKFIQDEKYPFKIRYGFPDDNSEAVRNINARKKMFFKYGELPIDDTEYNYLMEHLKV